MRHLTRLIPLMLMIFSLTLAGCGSSGSTTPSDPLAAVGTVSGTGTTVITAQDPKVNLTVTPDKQKIDANIGTVLLTAKLISSSSLTYLDTVTGEILYANAGDSLPNKTVTFRILAGPGTISYTTPVTDKNGVSTAVLTTGDVNYTTNVLIEASTTVDNNVYRAYTSLQIVRGSGVIMFTGNAGLTPGSQINQLADVAKSVYATIPAVTFLQQVPFKVTDSNGNPRVGVPVSLSISSQTGAALTLGIDNSPVTTDSAGQGIFNVTVTLSTPPSGSFTSASAIYYATTNDAIPVTAYIGGAYSLTALIVPPLTLSPYSATFGTTNDIALTISGGSPPYTISSSNTALVTAILSGNTVIAHLVDTSAWTQSVTITVTDASGDSARTYLYR